MALAAPVSAQVVRPGDVKAGVDAWGRGDYRTAVDKWRPAAIAGDADAQFNLGQAYKLGRGVPVDLALAESWFNKAALQGHLQAQDNYGLALYTSGRKAEAAPWLEKSVARGEPRGELVLGTMLFNGDGVQRDYPRAYALMTLASQKGLKSASETLAQMDQFISPADRQQGQRLAASARTQQAVAAPVRTAAVAPRPAPVLRPVATAAAPAPRPASGGWRIQLGAFRDHANAAALWTRLQPRLGSAQPFYATAGAVTRLQAGGYASKAEAQRACAASGSACMVVAP
jgi:TPR repeat protein